MSNITTLSERLKKGRAPLLTTRDQFELRQLREAGVSVKDAAAHLNVSVATAMRALAELRRKLGPEKLPNKERMRSHLTRREIPPPAPRECAPPIPVLAKWLSAPRPNATTEPRS